MYKLNNGLIDFTNSTGKDIVKSILSIGTPAHKGVIEEQQRLLAKRKGSEVENIEV